ncbi:hypothetical protein SARC_10007 [Sphaeroforma arctica JP610]|uniref:Rad21/Rec8-like protein N-terminal domain-containing protein n=1 Tax=Sphaeroforma arctica JP610 TaxID=667725 RepID=A0A0L0FNE6_9EUKA|nr:hypothetical protein SARC_10007 [Sphaeroforma arctica JP610]KNC77533.1 hypothetical protein SARC_10007 [Sphaeroforma arctica JP610]|eukprot:XP_014151435.1 hypothetical protein SARC_10007 [Sphaeroforma arctica JP610]
MHPKEPLALRLSSNLLVGVARIYNKQQIIFWAETGAIWSQVQKKTREHTNENLLTLQNDLAREDNITLHPLNTTDGNMLRNLLEEINLDDVATDEHFTTSQLFSSTANTTTMPTPTTRVPDAPLSDAYYTGSNSNAHITSARDEEINLNTQDHHNLDMEANLDLDVTMGQLDLSLDPELDFSAPTGPSGQSEPMDMGVDFEMQMDHHDVAAPVHVPDDIGNAETQETTMGLAQMDSLATPDAARTSERHVLRAPRARKNKRNKRNSIIMDTSTTIDGQTMRQNLADASDLVAWPKKVV